MDEVMNSNCTNEAKSVSDENGLIEYTDGLLMDVRASIGSNKVLSVPIAELSALGAGVSSLIPAFNTVTQTMTIATDGYYQIANAVAGDVPKIAKNGNIWGAMKTAAGGSKMMQLTEVRPLSATIQAAEAFNPAIMMMAVALYSIERDMKKIAETQKQILSFLEIENESQIEADVESLMGIAANYKYNWDNERTVASSHNLVMGIKNRARKNMIAYQKKTANAISSKQLIVAQSKVNAALFDLEKKFKYYRLSLYTFSFASLMEIMLSGNFKEEYITEVKDEIKNLSDCYREQFENSSLYLEKLGNAGIEANVVKGIGAAGKAVGKLIGSIPIVKEGSADEFLQDKGAGLQKNAIGMERKAVKAFASVANPGTGVFVEKLEDMIQIYNHTSKICFDSERIYLLA